MARLKIAFPYLLFAAMTAGVVWSNLGGGPSVAPAPEAAQAEARHEDPVCHMEVNPAWGYDHQHEGQTYWFCCEMCRKRFANNPDSYLGERCPVCDREVVRADAWPATYLKKTYYLCSEAHRTEFKADPAGFFMHTMWGIPDWLYYFSIGLVLAVSFLMFEGLGRRRNPQMTPPARWDLMGVTWLARLIRSRVFRFALQLLMVGAFVLIVVSGLYGNPNPALNIAPILTWTIWWGGLVILILFGGKAWCYMCPWDTIAGWLERLRLWKKTDRSLGLGLPWPKLLRNIVLASFLFVGLTWVELGFGVTMNPRATAWLGIALLLMAVVSAFIFQRRSFCRYGCLVGRISGLYALFSGIEVRSRDKATCKGCKTKECIKGSQTAYGCPTFEYPGDMSQNTYCIQCMECVQACPHDNLAVNLRPLGSDLNTAGKPRADEAYLALLMLSITAFHGLTMTPVWGQMTGAMEAALPVGRVVSFSLGMLGIMVAPVIIYAGLVWLSYRLSTGSRAGESSTSYRDYFIRYAYCLLPIALFYHLAHNLEHLLMEGPKVVALMSDPMGRGWNLFGTAGWSVPPLVSLEVLWVLQVVLVALGHVYSLWAANRISRRTFQDPAAATRGQWPLLIGMIAFSVFSLWLLKQPMEMRTSAM